MAVPESGRQIWSASIEGIIRLWREVPAALETRLARSRGRSLVLSSPTLFDIAAHFCIFHIRTTMGVKEQHKLSQNLLFGTNLAFAFELGLHIRRYSTPANLPTTWRSNASNIMQSFRFEPCPRLLNTSNPLMNRKIVPVDHAKPKFPSTCDEITLGPRVRGLTS